jgi:hypothetical protein
MPWQGETNGTVIVSLRAVALVGWTENTMAPDPVHGSSTVVGMGADPYWVKVTDQPAAALGVTSWATMLVPRDPVKPPGAVEDEGEETPTV